MNEGDSINWPNLIGLRLSSHKWDEAEAELYCLECAGQIPTLGFSVVGYSL